jgi:hypothetical protein
MVLLLAAGWLALIVLLGIVVLAAGAAQAVMASPSPINNPDPCSTPPATCTPTVPAPTDTPPAPTATAPAATDTPTTAADTPVPTDTPDPSGGGGVGGGGVGGGGGGGGDQSGGAQPTKVVLAQPTVSSDNSPLASLSPGAISSNGLLIATSLSCVVAILGLIVAAVAMYVLVNGGYGPFLKALVLGKRAGRGASKGAQAAGSAYANKRGTSSDAWGQSGAYEFDGSAEYRAQPPRASAPNRNGGGRSNSGPREGSPSPRTGPRDNYAGPRSGPRSGPPQQPAQTRDLREW